MTVVPIVATNNMCGSTSSSTATSSPRLMPCSRPNSISIPKRLGPLPLSGSTASSRKASTPAIALSVPPQAVARCMPTPRAAAVSVAASAANTLAQWICTSVVSLSVFITAA
eukprot:12555-Heterococcus_DN1.PRE.2